MKLKLAFTTFIFIILAYAASGQSLKTWKWDDYKMKFKVPTDFVVKESTGTKFSAGNGKLHLTIYPKKGRSMEESDLKSALRTWASDQNVEYEGGVKKMTNLNGYWGVYIDGTGDNGLPTSLLLLVDPDFSTTALYIWLQYKSSYLDTAVDILKSFVPN